MLISKSLFVDYKEFPKLAWFKQNNLDKYKWIKWIEDEETSENLIELWQKVEDLMWEYFLKKEWLVKLDVFEDNSAKNPNDEEDEDIYLIQDNYKLKRETNLKNTIKAIKNREPLIYQPWFMIDWLFVRWDYLRLNKKTWNYDLIEVKAKTWVRKDKTFQNVKNKWKWNLENKFLSDISFQKYVINKVLKQEWLPELEKFYYAYLNHEFKKDWEINVRKIVVLDEINIEKLFILKSEDDEKDIKISDFLLTDLVIEETIKKIKKELILTEEEFNKIHLFTWSKFIEYTWEDRKFWTIYWKWLTSAKAIKELHYNWNKNLDELNNEEQELFNKSNWDVWSARQYIINYLESKKEWKDLIDSESIKLELDDIKYPICFYDYESCSVPIPFLDNVWPYQHAVVQYSLHKVYEDWKIEHFWGVLTWTWEKTVNEIQIDNNKNKVNSENEKIITWWYKDLLDEFIKDIWDDLDKTFIVWYKPFENTRNKEIAETFPKLKDAFLEINSNTYDLMDIFKKWYFYSLNFKGSNSIKYILPALVPNMSYEWMNIPDWLTAMQVLNDIITWNIVWKEKENQIKNLLLYCGQDSLAMYEIYKVIKNRLDN